MAGREPDPDAARDAIEYCYERGWTDGLPVVPASRELVDRFLERTARSPDEVLWRMDHLTPSALLRRPRSTRRWRGACRSTSRSCWPRGTR